MEDEIREDIFDIYIVASKKRQWELAIRAFNVLQKYDKKHHPEYYKERKFQIQNFVGKTYVNPLGKSS